MPLNSRDSTGRVWKRYSSTSSEGDIEFELLHPDSAGGGAAPAPGAVQRATASDRDGARVEGVSDPIGDGDVRATAERARGHEEDRADLPFHGADSPG